MTLEQALQRLTSDLGNDSDNDVALTTDELQRLLDESQIPDVLGLRPGLPGYVPTWDHNRAAAAGWEMKANRLATTQTTTGQGGEVSPDDFRYLNAVRQRDFYEAQRPAAWLA